MLRGLIMEMPLLVSSLIAHADRCHGDTEIVSRTVEGPGEDGAGAVHRYTYSQAHRRSKQLAQTLALECKRVKGWVAMTDRAHMPQAKLPNLLCYEELLAREDGNYEWPH